MTSPSAPEPPHDQVSAAGAGPPRPPAPLEMRASDAEREQVADVLRSAAGDGRLTVEELDTRLQAAYLAVTRAELETLTVDLPSTSGAAPARSSTSRGTRWVISIMGGHERAGRWRIAERCAVVNFWGGSQLDLSHAELSGPMTTITMVSIMGGGEIRLPDGVGVSVSKLGLMGGNDVKLSQTAPPRGAPVIHIRLLSIMGGASVEQGPRKRRRAGA
jgi:hypothetical protein